VEVHGGDSPGGVEVHGRGGGGEAGIHEGGGNSWVGDSRGGGGDFQGEDYVYEKNMAAHRKTNSNPLFFYACFFFFLCYHLGHELWHAQPSQKAYFTININGSYVPPAGKQDRVKNLHKLINITLVNLILTSLSWKTAEYSDH
jgi:hypothetical protein